MSLPLILLARYFAQMNIMNLALLLHFAERHPESRNALFSWLRLVRSERWHNPHDAIALHSNVRNLGSNRLTFNIRGNRYRLIAKVNYESGDLTIRFIGTHAQYDRIDAREV